MCKFINEMLKKTQDKVKQICSIIDSIDIENDKRFIIISRDEDSHTDFACLLYEHIKDKPSKEEIENMFREAVMIEKEFICESLPCSLLGMNSELMSQYIEYVADRLLLMFGLEKVYHSENPFDWMELISVQGKTNFFEKRVGEYANKANPNVDKEKNEIGFDSDF